MAIQQTLVWTVSFSSSRTRASEPCRRSVSRLKLISRTSPSGLLDPCARTHAPRRPTHPLRLTFQTSRAHMRVLPVCGSCPSPLRWARLASQDDTTSLMAASQYGHWEVVKRLIAAGAKVDAAKKVNPPIDQSTQLPRRCTFYN
jgi:hypothetical protein